VELRLQAQFVSESGRAVGSGEDPWGLSQALGEQNRVLFRVDEIQPLAGVLFDAGACAESRTSCADTGDGCDESFDRSARADGQR
jgi:hypothetical protein